MNDVLVEPWEYFKISSEIITHKYLKKTHLFPPYLPNKITNHQYCLTDNKTSNIQSTDEIESIAKARVAPKEMELIRTTYWIVFHRDKEMVRSSRNLLLRTAAYDTARIHNVLPL